MKRFKESLATEWLKYVIVVILSVALWVSAFGIYHAPREYEKIEFFFGGGVHDHSFEKAAEKALDGVKKVQIVSSDPKDK